MGRLILLALAGVDFFGCIKADSLMHMISRTSREWSCPVSSSNFFMGCFGFSYTHSYDETGLMTVSSDSMVYGADAGISTTYFKHGSRFSEIAVEYEELRLITRAGAIRLEYDGTFPSAISNDYPSVRFLTYENGNPVHFHNDNFTPRTLTFPPRTTFFDWRFPTTFALAPSGAHWFWKLCFSGFASAVLFKCVWHNNAVLDEYGRVTNIGKIVWGDWGGAANFVYLCSTNS